MTTPTLKRLALAAACALAGCSGEDARARPDAGPAPATDAAATSTVAEDEAPSQLSLTLAAGMGRVELPPAARRLGVRRDRVRRVAPGPRVDDPTIAVTPEGRVFVAHVRRKGPREMIVLSRARGPRAPLQRVRKVVDASRAWHPRLASASGEGGAVWLAWCARKAPGSPNDHQRDVFLRRIAPAPMGPEIEVARPRAGPEDRSRRCDPDLAVDASGQVHVVWEDAPPDRPNLARIAYRAFDPEGRPLGPPEALTEGPFDRRPAIWADRGQLWVAWDRRMDTAPTGAIDPDYDVFARHRREGAWSDEILIDGEDGIQAAPSLASDGGGALIAYHTSLPHGLVKRFTVRRLTDGGKVQDLLHPPRIQALMPTGQNQGSEMPALVRLVDGRLLVASRASHGALVHVLSGEGSTPALDLTRRGWGARGLRLDAAQAPDGAVLIARRARHGVALERLVVAPSDAGPAVFRRAPKPRKLRLDVPPDLSPPSGGTAGLEVYYGDVHMHSAYSDGTGPPDELYSRCFARGLHFCTVTDHDFIVGAQMMLSEHDEIRWLTDVFEAEPGFSALHAYEWTTKPVPRGYGHRNVYFRGDSPSPLLGTKNGYPDTPRLHRALLKMQAFTAPHHTGWTGTDWSHANPAVQRMFELVSVHGAFEDPRTQPLPTRGVRRGMFAVDGLRKGKKFGFLGGSDGHGILWHHGIGRRMDPWIHGLTGVIAPAPERGAVWDAMFARRTFATSGARMVVLTWIDDAPQGAEIELRGPPEIRWRAQGTLPLRELVVMRDGRPVHIERPGRLEAAGRFVDEEARPGRHSYYVRITQGQGLQGTDAAWSSPIFVTRRGP